MARKPKHEDHLNHEAWAIPYGDLITLLLAFFVVMYSMSSVNEGKYRILSDSLVAAFRGAPKTLAPVSVGKESGGKGGDTQMSGVTPSALLKLPDPRPVPESGKERIGNEDIATPTGSGKEGAQGGKDGKDSLPPLLRMAQDIQQAMQSLIDKKLVVVRREPLWLEVEIRTDILFDSGSSGVSPSAKPILQELAGILKPFPNPVRVEGHTDNRPIATKTFPSNWELSAARAASVVHLFMTSGMNPKQLEIIGLGEHRPIASNDTVEGRNANRRVRVVILENSGLSEEVLNLQNRADAAAGGPAVAEPGSNRLLINVKPQDFAQPKSAPQTEPATGTQPAPAQPPKSTVLTAPPGGAKPN